MHYVSFNNLLSQFIFLSHPYDSYFSALIFNYQIAFYCMNKFFLFIRYLAYFCHYVGCLQLLLLEPTLAMNILIHDSLCICKREFLMYKLRSGNAGM